MLCALALPCELSLEEKLLVGLTIDIERYLRRLVLLSNALLG